MALIGDHDDDNPRIHISLGRRTVVLNHRYEALSILNDIFIGIFFTVGSVFFFLATFRRLQSRYSCLAASISCCARSFGWLIV